MGDTRCFASKLPIGWGDRVVAIPLVYSATPAPGDPWNHYRCFFPCGVPVRGVTDDFGQFEQDKAEDFLLEPLRDQTKALEPEFGEVQEDLWKYGHHRYLAKAPHFISSPPTSEVRRVVLSLMHEDLYDSWLNDPEYVPRWMYERGEGSFEDKSVTYRVLKGKALDAYYELGDPEELWPKFVEENYRIHGKGKLDPLGDLDEFELGDSLDAYKDLLATMKMMGRPIVEITEGLCDRRGYARNLEPWLSRKLEGVEKERFLDLHAVFFRMCQLGIPWNIPLSVPSEPDRKLVKHWLESQYDLLQSKIEKWAGEEE